MLFPFDDELISVLAFKVPSVTTDITSLMLNTREVGQQIISPSVRANCSLKRAKNVGQQMSANNWSGRRSNCMLKRATEVNQQIIAHN